MDNIRISVFGFGNDWNCASNFANCAILYGDVVLLCKEL